MANIVDDTVNIVILGGSFAGLSVAYGFLGKIDGHLPITRTAPKYRVVMVSPSTHLYWNISLPRALVSPELIPHSKSFFSIIESFAKYPASKFQFVQGAAINVETTQRVVTVSLVGEPRDRRSRVLHLPTLDFRRSAKIYKPDRHTIPCPHVARGSSADSLLLFLNRRHERTIGAMSTFHIKLIDAGSVLICGGGPSGCEIAGQLSIYFNEGLKGGRAEDGTPRQGKLSDMAKRLSQILSPVKSSSSGEDWLSRRPRIGRRNSSYSFLSRLSFPFTDRKHYKTPASEHKPKLINLISGNERLLTRFHPPSRKTPNRNFTLLASMSSQELPSGKAKVILYNDDILLVDCYTGATGVKPNTSFLSPELRDASGYVSVDRTFPHVDRAGDRVYAIVDCATYSKNYALDIYDASPVLLYNLRNDLKAHELRR
ncbi:hypothetical protein P152DRAFT_298783 [Eremomyces bilateralis CBS 781.70]|uniref:FAD/NAD(P)-binding domain-containing protein n=1 Tax=Eremomyces bilateralis CBS 781.70 TaxID=1392243 RepID=A0A6G1G7S5_9PEZI|nr:uncharacterized protein P152DRAFT_298783 [Eremomyces bilateralis CBS 781.70]KAF1813940.1 hypothetical protein P152DRAFT_298783 [Eremomyces bilateralis CBS 781.70]